MKEEAESIYERLGTAIDELQKDLQYKPLTFFGIAMWPDTIWSSISGFATIIGGFLA